MKCQFLIFKIVHIVNIILKLFINSKEEINLSNNRYQGDPKLFLDEDGVYLRYKGGQPVMGQGFENKVNIQLLVKSGWCGNVFLSSEKQIGSNFLDTAQGSITIDKLNDIRQAAEVALKNQAFGNITVTVTNPESSFINVEIIIEPPGKDIQKLVLQKNWGNWIAQIFDPAHRRE